MSTLVEIEEAVTRLSEDEKRQLMLFVMRSLQPDEMPEPRIFTKEQIQAWIDEDERAGREYLTRKKASAQ